MLTTDTLYTREGLAALDQAFVAFLPDALAHMLLSARDCAPDDESALILELTPYLDDFLAIQFEIKSENDLLATEHHRLTPLYKAQRLFVQRRASRISAEGLDGSALYKELELHIHPHFTDLELAIHILSWMENEEAHQKQLELALHYSAWALHNRPSTLFHVPHKIDPTHLVQFETVQIDGVTRLKTPENLKRAREGFKLTDQGFTLTQALSEVHYCIFCHKQSKDSCSKGLKDKAAGCPLEEKISEMHVAKSQGLSIGALGIITIDNPMCAATGHRICNDCMKACIYQKQDPVNIPQAESRTLKDVLSLPYGFEIYSLLTRWNPLNFKRPLPKPESGYKILVVGLGPAGFTLAHHLMNEGHTVVGIDGLKIEPLDIPFTLLKNFPYEDLDTRNLAGFGGVAEYGITVRWDKNNLKIIRLLLERRSQFLGLGGVRFGGTLTLEQAFDLGFDHIALCMGAGKPTLLNLKNGLAPGVRQASDFLMALQLTGAAQKDSIANLEIELPIVVIGGGLTAIDTTTEALAYYAVQVEKFLSRYETLKVDDTIWSPAESTRVKTWLAHAKALIAEPDPMKRQALLQGWGGASLVYRSEITQAPSYRLNHEEVALAIQEGIYLIEQMTPSEIEIDEYGHANALIVKDPEGAFHRIPARSILVAAGTQPNTVLARESATPLELDGKYFKTLNGLSPEKSPKPADVNILMHKTEDDRYVSFFGDLHPSYAGNVVKAMASAKQGFPIIHDVLQKRTPTQDPEFLTRMKDLFSAHIVRIDRLTPTIIEIVIHAPLAARAFKPGQFYRLQNFGPHPMEGLALTGAWVEGDLISTIVLEMGGSSNLCAKLQPREPVILMGPTGTPTHIPHNQHVCLMGGGLGNAVLFSIGQACRAQGCHVTYFAGYKKIEDRYKVSEIEKAADEIIWCCDETPGFKATRPQDHTFVGNILEALAHHKDLVKTADEVIVIGSDRMMAAVASARHQFFKTGHKAIASINSPMQCMMKEICAQCLQRHIDPITGEETIVFSCFNQDQDMETVDFTCLKDRLSQNSAQEKLTALWIKKT